MSDPQQHGPTGRIGRSEEQGGELTRRTVLVGVAAETGRQQSPVSIRSRPPAASIRTRCETWFLFILLSAALTGNCRTEAFDVFPAPDEICRRICGLTQTPAG